MVIFHECALLELFSRSYLLAYKRQPLLVTEALTVKSTYTSGAWQPSAAAPQWLPLNCPDSLNVEWKEKRKQLLWSFAAASAFLTTWQIHSSDHEAADTLSQAVFLSTPVAHSSHKPLIFFFFCHVLSFFFLLFTFFLKQNGLGRLRSWSQRGARFWPNCLASHVTIFISLTKFFLKNLCQEYM